MDGLSFFTRLQRNNPDRDGSPLVKLARSMVEQEGTGDWNLWLDGIWCFMQPANYRMRDQGWKLHVAAIPVSAGAVLERALGVLLRQGCAFKFASTLDDVVMLNSRHYSRGGAGKFMTVYPDCDKQFCQLAEELDTATAGLPGPAILSDRPYRVGSLVHYRYGAFVGRMVLSNENDYRVMLQSPDGSLVEDRRDAWFNPPAWAPSPFGEPEAAEVGTAATGPVLLGDRFVVREAIRHANKGGVYRATDTRTDAEVIVKEARPYVEADEFGRDVRDLMRHEAEILDAIAPLGVATHKLELFEQAGHVFLVEELVPGVPLSRWLIGHMTSKPGLSWPLVVTMARQLAELLAVVHAGGLVLRDLTPSNVMVTPEGGLQLIDLEFAARPGADVLVGGTPGYAAPEQLAGAPVAMEADLFSLGAIIFTLATTTSPRFLDDEPPIRSLQERLEDWLDTTAECNETPRRLKPLILGLMNPTPEQRWDLERVQAFLDAARILPTTPRTDEPGPGGRRLAPGDYQGLITDGVEYLLTSMSPEQDELWPSVCFGARTDPCNMHNGASGVLAVLTQAARLECRGGVWGDGSDLSERLRDALRIASEWIERRLSGEPHLLPGLHFGRSGTAWALFDAAQLLGDAPMAERALALAKRFPLSWPNPDVTHGVAGVGLTQLYLWQATGDTEFYRRTQRCADHLVAVAERQSTGVLWKVPASFDSEFAGNVYYGFAHGVAGIAWFVLAAGLATDRGDCLELARMAGETLCATAQRDEGGATWATEPGDEGPNMVHWCHGSSGIGTFLIRLWQATGDERFRALAEMAAVAVVRAKWHSSPVFCHGLAGNGQFLLDMAAALGDVSYRTCAEDFAAILFARRAYRDGRIVIHDETGNGVGADYGNGLAGMIAFFLRLRHGGPRMWMAEPESSLAAVGTTR